MNKMDKLKAVYQSTEIPAELSDAIEKALSKEVFDQAQQETVAERQEHEKIMINEKQGKKERSSKKKIYRRTCAAVAALAITFGSFGIMVSTNAAFAASVSDVPLLGALAKVFTGKEVKENDGIVNVDVKLPKVEGLTDQAVQNKINKEIEVKMTAVVEEAKVRVTEEYEDWIETGGNPNDYMVREIYVDYEVKAITGDVLSFAVSKMETGASAYYELYYYNINLHTNESVTLRDILGKNYIAKANEQIEKQIAERSKIQGNVFFDGSDGIEGFKTITEEQNFFVNEKGNVVVVFNKYEIAPGYMGILEFEITK